MSCRLFFILFFHTLLFAQQPYHYIINEETGLPSDESYCVLQDDKGYIWLGCEVGLFRYDGLNFKSYTNSNQNARAISSLKIDLQGKLWCQNFSGQIYAVENDSLKIKVDVSDRINNHPCFDIDFEGRIFFGLPQGLFVMDSEGKEEHILDSLSVVEVKILDEDHLIFFTKRGDFYSYNFLKNDLKKVELENEDLHFCWFSKNYSQQIILGANNNSAQFKMFLLDNVNRIEKETQISTQLPENIIFYTTYKTDDSTIWVTTSSGAYRFINGNKNLHLFEGQRISNLLIDKENNIWFTSLDNGIYVVPEIQMKIFNSKNSGLKDQNVTSLEILNDTTLVLGTFSGSAFTLNIKTNELKLLSQNEDFFYRAVSSIIVDKNSFLLSRNYLSEISSDGKFIREKLFDYFRDLKIINDRLYFASTIGVGYFTKHSDGTFDFTQYHLIGNNAAKKIVYSKADDRIWVILSSGLAYIKNEQLCYFNEANKIFASGFAMQDTLLWVATIDEGVYGICKDKIIYHLTNENLLRGDAVNSIYSNEKYLIISTNQSINLFDTECQQSYFIDFTDGLTTKDVNAIRIHHSDLYIATSKGLYVFEESSWKKNTVRPTIYLNQILVNGENYSDDFVELSYNDELKISFDALSFKSRNTAAIKYRFTNQKGKWTTLEFTQREINFPSLPVGEYELEIITVNEDGFYAEQSLLIPIKVSAPFWQKWWFYVVIVVLISLIIFSIYRYQIKSLRKKIKMKELLIESQLRTLKAQMNPHFIFNSLNSIQDLILMQDMKNSYTYLNKFSQLMRKVLEYSEVEEISLADEIAFLNIYLDLEKLRFGDEFVFEIEVDEKIQPNYEILPSMLLQPFVENAIKHGLLHKKGTKNLTVKFSKDLQNNILQCVIKDNGVGRKRSAEINERNPLSHKSYATKAVSKRLDLLKAGKKFFCEVEILDLTNENDLANGTKVILKITSQRTSVN